MRYIDTLVEGETIRNIYLCKGKRSAETRNGKPYDNLILQDKTGTLDGKVWDPNSNGIADYDEGCTKNCFPTEDRSAIRICVE